MRLPERRKTGKPQAPPRVSYETPKEVHLWQ